MTMRQLKTVAMMFIFCVTGARLLLADPIYFSGTNHFYEFVAADHIHWDVARDAAAASDFHGAQGYLATVTSQAEQDFLFANFGSIPDLWLGASDAASELDWFWVTGPEAGLQFYSGQSGPLAYVYPGFTGGDNDSNEDYLVWNHNGAAGGWNDYGIAGRGPAPSTEALSGYLVEYSANAVPEPSSLVLLGTGSIVAFCRFRRRRNS